MKANKMAPAIQPNEIEPTLRSVGLNPTAQRIAICRYALCEAHHLTADDVKTWADQNFPKLSLATVYNTLNALVKAGLLKELRLPHTDRVVYDNVMTDHYHLLDESTGELVDIPVNEVQVTPTNGAIGGSQWSVRGVDVLFKATRAS